MFELAVGALGWGISLLLPHLDQISALVSAYSRDANGWYSLSAVSYVARVGIAVALLTPITLLMGGTLTLVIRHLVRGDIDVHRRRIAILYAVNTAGAAAGCFLTDFTLVPAWGLRNTQLVAVTFNLLAGAGALALAARSAAVVHVTAERVVASSAKNRGKRKPARAVDEGTTESSRVVLFTSLALALSGFAALGMEIVWFRHFSIMLGAFRAVFSLLLTVILVGIGAGAMAAAVVQRRTRRAAEWLLAIQALFIVVTLGGMATADSSAIDRTVSSALGAFRNVTAIEEPGAPGTLTELWFDLRPMILEVALPA